MAHIDHSVFHYLHLHRIPRTSSLTDIVTYVVKVESLVWFRINDNFKFTEGPKHFFKLMQLVKCLPAEMKDIAAKSIPNNSFCFADPALLVTAMLES